MSIFNNTGWVNLKSEDREGFVDLEVSITKGDLINVKSGRDYNLAFTIAEIEALHNFAQILKLNFK